MTLKNTLLDGARADNLAPLRVIAEELHVCVRTTRRWVAEHPELHFPAPIMINGRWYFSRMLIDHWKLERVKLSIIADSSVAQADIPLDR